MTSEQSITTNCFRILAVAFESLHGFVLTLVVEQERGQLFKLQSLSALLYQAGLILLACRWIGGQLLDWFWSGSAAGGADRAQIPHCFGAILIIWCNAKKGNWHLERNRVRGQGKSSLPRATDHGLLRQHRPFAAFSVILLKLLARKVQSHEVHSDSIVQIRLLTRSRRIVN